ncbi:MAG TPA: hypothetical protein DDW19_03295, partial [Anaerolineaceae bacterium]|nr:hypothetical protein [Anaerolineaceae bacterium]
MSFLVQKYRKLLEDARAIAALAESEDRGFTEEEKTRVANILEDAKKVKGDIEINEQLSGLELPDDVPQKKQYKGSIAGALLDDP